MLPEAVQLQALLFSLNLIIWFDLYSTIVSLISNNSISITTVYYQTKALQ